MNINIMENPQHELIQSNYGLPFKSFTFRGIDSDKKIPLHWHNHIELLFCLEGSLSVVVSGQTFLLHENEMILINTNTIHASFSPTVNHVLCIQFPLEWLCTQIGQGYGQKWLIKLNSSNEITGYDQPLIDKLLKITAVTERQNYNVMEKLELHGQIFLLLKMLMSYTIPVTKNTTEDPAFLFGTEMVSYINAHFQNKLSLQDISRHFGYSSEYCSRNFKKVLGINFKELLTSTRLNYAYDKIINSNDNLEEIALAAGFNTYRNMYNSFVKSYHTAPSQLREKKKFE